MINRVVLAGRLIKEPSIRETKTGAPAGDFTIAVRQRMPKLDGPTHDFYRCVVFGHNATTAGEMREGEYLIAEGHLRTRRFTTSQGSREVVEIGVDRITPLKGVVMEGDAEEVAKMLGRGGDEAVEIA